MKKTLIGTTAAIVIGLFSGVPYFLGGKAQESLEAQHKIIADTFFFKVEDHQYQRGWFSSTETTVVRFHPDVLANFSKQIPDNIKLILDKPIKLVNHVQHGLFAEGLTPVRAVVTTEFQYDPEVQKVLTRFFADKIPMSMKNTIHLDGSGHVEMQVSPFDYEELSGIKLAWQGMQSAVDYENGLNNYTSTFTIPSLKAILADKGVISIEKIEIKSQTRAGSSGIDLGASDTKIGQFEVSWKENIDYNLRLNELVNMVTDWQVGAFINPTGSIPPSTISVQNLTYQTKTDEQNQFINSQGRFAFEKLQYGEEQYGPLVVDIAAEHLDGKSLNDLKKRWKQLTLENLSEEQMNEALLKSVREEGAGLFTNNPQFKINQFDFTTPNGHIKANGQLGFNGLQTTDLNDLPNLVKKMSANVNLDVSKTLLEQFAISQARSLFATPDDGDQQAQKDVDDTIRLIVNSSIDNMTGEGYLQQNNQAVQTNLSLANSEIKLNGKVFKLESDEELLASIEADDEMKAASASAP